MDHRVSNPSLPRRSDVAKPLGFGTAAAFLPERLSLPSLRAAAASCTACPLFAHATQTVFGEGRRTSRVLLVGEQPGDKEDLAGKPFVGPAGRELDLGLAAAGIARADAYVTNTVKHFKWEPRGKRRLHKKPNAREIRACAPWLEAELAVVSPEVVVCLGATAVSAVLGSGVKVMRDHGRVVASRFSVPAIATIHPSAILRAPDDDARHAARAGFVADLRAAARLLA
jgi:uracil-DNA glycosylase family protein